MPIISKRTGGGLAFTGLVASGKATYSDFRSIRKFYAPLPEDVTERIPSLKKWQDDNWKAWEAFLEVLNSPIYNRMGVLFGQDARRRVVPALPVMPCPMPSSMLEKFDSLKQWQKDSASLWHKICQLLSFRVEGGKEYGDLSDYSNKTMEDYESMLNINEFQMPLGAAGARLKRAFPVPLPSDVMKRYKDLEKWNKLSMLLARKVMAIIGVASPSQISDITNSTDDSRNALKFPSRKDDNLTL